MNYKDKFNAQMKKAGINSLDDLKTDAEKKAFFKAVDKSHDAKNESLTEELVAIAEGMKEGGPGSGPQGDNRFGRRTHGSDKKSGPIAKALSKVFKKKTPAKSAAPSDDEQDEYDSQILGEMMKEMMKEMDDMPEMKMLKAETDPTKVEMMKKEMMKEMAEMSKMPEMSDMPEMMKKEMMKEMMKEMSKKMNEYGSMNIVAMKEGLTPAQKKLPAGLQQAILKKNKEKKERVEEMVMKAMKTGEADAEPNAEMLNAMVKDPHKSKEDKPMKDMNAMYMKSDVRADVKNNGGADMAKVKDAPKMQTAMKKINAMYKTEKYLDEKPGSIQNVVAQMQVDEMKTVTVRVKEFSQMVETYLARGGVKGFINAELTEGKQVLPLKEVRTFIDTYNKHFLTNYRAEEFIVRDRLNEAMMGNYKIENDPMAGEFGFVSKKAFDDNQKKVGGNKGVMTMVKRGMNPDMIAKKYGMYPDAVRKMAKGQTL